MPRATGCWHQHRELLHLLREPLKFCVPKLPLNFCPPTLNPTSQQQHPPKPESMATGWHQARRAMATGEITALQQQISAKVSDTCCV